MILLNACMRNKVMSKSEMVSELNRMQVLKSSKGTAIDQLGWNDLKQEYVRALYRYRDVDNENNAWF